MDPNGDDHFRGLDGGSFEPLDYFGAGTGPSREKDADEGLAGNLASPLDSLQRIDLGSLPPPQGCLNIFDLLDSRDHDHGMGDWTRLWPNPGRHGRGPAASATSEFPPEIANAIAWV